MSDAYTLTEMGTSKMVIILIKKISAALYDFKSKTKRFTIEKQTYSRRVLG